MSFFDQPFDANTVAPKTAFKPLPDGEYTVLITKAKEEPTKDRTGLMLHYEAQVVDGSCKGRVIHDRITLRNKNPIAVEIGQGQLSALCHATGIMRPRGAHEFVGKTVKIKVAVVKRKDNDELSNEVKGILLSDAPKAAPAAPAAPAPAAGQPPAWG